MLLQITRHALGVGDDEHAFGVLDRVGLTYLWLCVVGHYLPLGLVSIAATVDVHIHIFRLCEIEEDPELIVLSSDLLDLPVCQHFVDFDLVEASIISALCLLTADGNVAEAVLRQRPLPPPRHKRHVIAISMVTDATHFLIGQWTEGEDLVVPLAIIREHRCVLTLVRVSLAVELVGLAVVRRRTAVVVFVAARGRTSAALPAVLRVGLATDAKPGVDCSRGVKESTRVMSGIVAHYAFGLEALPAVEGAVSLRIVGHGHQWPSIVQLSLDFNDKLG